MNKKLKGAIKKELRKLEENSFEAGVSGGGGTLNYSVGYGTPSGGNYTQNPSHFASSDKTVNNFTPNTTSGSAVAKMPNRPDTNQNNTMGGTTSPAAQADKLASEKPLDPNKQFDPQVDQLFQKKQTPSPDEVMCGLQQELGKMVKKDKNIAKQRVLKNLRKNSNYYSRLEDLNIDDEKMEVDENMLKETKLVDETTFAKTKAVLDEMIAAKQQKVAVANTPEINQIFKDLTDKRLARKKGIYD